MNVIRDNIALHAYGLSSNETSTTMLCPVCLGGRKYKQSFAVTRTPEGLALYICYRASCGIKGAIGISPDVSNPDVFKKSKEPNPYNHLTMCVPPERMLEFVKKFPHISEAYRNAMVWSEYAQRYIMPIHNKYYGTIGHVARSFSSDLKAITYWLTRQQGTCHYALSPKSSDTIIIVEDIPSCESIKNVAGAASLALLGSHLAAPLVHQLRNDGYKRIIMALDEDAWDKAYKAAHKYTLLGVEAITWPSGLDPKDMPANELIEIFGGL